MELTEHDFIQDEVGEEEINLAQKLKDLCKDGKEKKGTKLEAALLFHKLANIYENKTKHKKLNMTRSAALYNAAIVRDPEKQIFKDELKALCSAVLVKANAAKPDSDLICLAVEVKKRLKKFRKYFCKRFNQLEITPDDVKDDELMKLQTKKIFDVKHRQNEVMRRYTELMRFISDKCIKIMGAPPCKYAVVGLGSLARSEITMYSDFEHIIVLDNYVARIEDQKIIMKYFQWFTTIFNIILINLGETMINCVAIPSINPRYRDWFTDIVTPNGVTFDGMVAHACIRPLGRPATKNKEKTEFIKPVDEMIQYLDSDEQVKQGYHVADALSKACFVAGDEAICEEYKEKAHLRITANNSKSDFSTVSKQIEQNLQNLNLKNLHTNAFLGFQNYNIKRAIYRGATLFISYIGRLCSLQASSCFDAIDGLENKGICSEGMAHQLRFMVAVACEVRAKVYQLKGQQEDVFMEGSLHDCVIPGLIEFVGKQSLVSFVEAIFFLQDTLNLCKADYRKWRFVGYVPKNIKTKMLTLLFLELNKDLVELVKQTISSPQADEIHIYAVAASAVFDCNEYDLVLEICSKINQFKLTANQQFECKVYEFASIVNRSYNKETESFEGSRTEVEARIVELEQWVGSLIPESKNVFGIIRTYSTALMLLNDGKIPKNSNVHEIWKQRVLKPEWRTENDLYESLLLSEYVRTAMENEPAEAIKLLDEAQQIVQPHDNLSKCAHMYRCHAYGTCYHNTCRYYEALLNELEYSRMRKKLKQPIADGYKQMIKNTFNLFMFRHPNNLSKSALTLTVKGKPIEAMSLLHEAKQLMQPYKNQTTIVHMLQYISFAVCYDTSGRYYESFICWLEYARICKKIKQPIDKANKQGIKDTFQQLLIFHNPTRLCKSADTLLDYEEYTEALKLLDEAKQLMQPYKSTTTEVHRLLCLPQHAMYYHNIEIYYKALICWLEYARICNELKQPIPDDIKEMIRDTFHRFIFRHQLKH